MAEFDVAGMDPSVPAPAMVVPVNPNADMPGHGRTLPLVGGRRTYALDVVYDEGKTRVYADLPQHVMGAIIDGYDAIEEALAAAEALGDRDAIADAATREWLARRDHARGVRATLQTRINAEAQSSGVWDTLTEEEQFQLTGAARGGVPVGVEVEWEIPGTDGRPVVYTQGIWTCPVPLVIDMGEYGMYSAENLPAPVSEVPVATDDEWGDIVGGWYDSNPANMVILDSSADAEAYMWSLQRAGVIDVTVYPAMVEDSIYLNALRAGHEILEQEGFDPDEWVGFHPETADGKDDL